MMTDFFIEFRFHGYPKQYLRRLIRDVSRKFRVKGAIKYRPVPHMTLYGPSKTTNMPRVFAAIKNVCNGYTDVPFKIEGFGWFDCKKGKVIHAGINASPELKKLRRELAEELSKISTPQPWDALPDYRFHTTIAFKDIDHNFHQIWHYLNKKEQPYINQHLLRVSILDKDSKILREYDLILRRWLNRRQALSGYWYWRTVTRLRELLGLPEERQPIFYRLINFVRNIGARKSVYLIGDTHFDHANIIRYCHRPFRNVQEMNRTLVRNWNNTVHAKDTVYFLGDWAFGRGARPAGHWMRQLKGHCFSIRGSHDRGVRGVNVVDSKVLHYGGYKFLLIHNPDKRQTPWDGWIIHGHKHNNSMRNFPFINGERRTINVGVELINYTPVSIDYLLSLHIDSIRRMATIDSKPQRW